MIDSVASLEGKTYFYNHLISYPYKNIINFTLNNTCHASRKISAPGRVFAFYSPSNVDHFN